MTIIKKSTPELSCGSYMVHGMDLPQLEYFALFVDNIVQYQMLSVYCVILLLLSWILDCVEVIQPIPT